MKSHVVVVQLTLLLGGISSASAHNLLTGSGNAAVDAKDARAIRALANMDQRRASTDAAHLQWIANRERQEVSKEEANVKDELADAHAIDLLSRNSTMQRQADMVNDALHLRQLAVKEEKRAIDEDAEVLRIQQDAEHLANAGKGRFKAMSADADALERSAQQEVKAVRSPLSLAASGNAAVDARDARAIRKVADMERKEASADATHLEWMASREKQEMSKEEENVSHELSDAYAIDLLARKANSTRGAEMVSDALHLRQLAVKQEQRVTHEDADVLRMQEDAAHILNLTNARYNARIADASVLERAVHTEGEKSPQRKK